MKTTVQTVYDMGQWPQIRHGQVYPRPTILKGTGSQQMRWGNRPCRRRLAGEHQKSFETPLIDCYAINCRSVINAYAIICHHRHVLCLSCKLMACVSTSRQIATQSPAGQWFRPHAKTAVDLTHKRSITTKPTTIQPPPMPIKIGSAGNGSILAD